MPGATLAITVVTPVYNGAATLPVLLTALRGLRLTGLGEIEFLFIDNASTDGSGALIEQFGLKDSRVILEPVKGVSAARNRGLANARGDVIAMIDADCVPTRHWLRELVAAFDDPTVLIAAGGLASYPPRSAAQRFAARYGLNDAGRNLTLGPGFANGRNMAVRVSVANELGGWRVEMDKGEDMEFSYRLMDRYHCKIQFRPLAMAFHQDRSDDEGLMKQAYGYGQGLAMMYSHHPGALPWGVPQRLRRARMTLRRRIGAARQRLARRMGRANPQDAEFATYLNMWNLAYWRGFDDEWRLHKVTR